MKPPITAAQAMSHPVVFETVKSLGQMADKLYTKAGALTKERDVLTERVKALSDYADDYMDQPVTEAERETIARKHRKA